MFLAKGATLAQHSWIRWSRLGAQRIVVTAMFVTRLSWADDADEALQKLRNKVNKAAWELSSGSGVIASGAGGASSGTKSASGATSSGGVGGRTRPGGGSKASGGTKGGAAGGGTGSGRAVLPSPANAGTAPVTPADTMGSDQETAATSTTCNGEKECKAAYENGREAYLESRKYCAKQNQLSDARCGEIEEKAVLCGVLYIKRLAKDNWTNDANSYQEVKRVVTSTLPPNFEQLYQQPDEIVALTIKTIAQLPDGVRRRAFVELIAALRDPGAAKKLKEWLSHSSKPRLVSLGQALNDNNYLSMVDILNQLQEEEWRQASTVLNNNRERKLGTGSSSVLLKVVVVDEGSNTGRAEFKNTLIQSLTIKFPERLQLVNAVDKAAWERLAKAAASSCARSPSVDQQCDALLIVRFNDENKALGTVWAIDDSEQGYRTDPEAADAVSNPISEDNAKAAAHNFLSELSRKFAVLQGDLNLATPDINKIGPTLHPGVSIDRKVETDADKVPKAFVQQLGLRLKGTCKQEDFTSRFLWRLGKSYRTYVGSLQKTPPSAPQLQLSLDATGNACLVSLREGDQSAPALQVVVTPGVNDWGNAGEDLGRVVGQFYVDAANAQSPPSRWNSLLLSGLPYLQDPAADKTTGWLFAASDMALVAAGVGSFALSINARNNATSSTTASLDAANNYIVIGTSLLVVAGIERIVSAATYSSKKETIGGK